MRARLLLAGIACFVLAGCGGGRGTESATVLADSTGADDLAAPTLVAAPESISVSYETTGAAPGPSTRTDPRPPARPTGSESRATSTDLGTRVYFRHCVVCHGPKGRGDGPGLLAPEPTPPDFLDHEYMSSRSDSALLRSIRRGKGEAAMPRWDRILSEEEMNAVLGFVRRFGAKR